MNEDRSLKAIMKTTLKKTTPEEQIQEIEDRVFMLEMADRLDDEVWNIIRALKEIKRDLEEELKCKNKN